jgi:hypothetical protein
MQYFTPENVVTVSLNLYQKRFKAYLKISLVSHLWSLIPIYGWAKYYAGMALISRLAFSEINGKTETINEAQTHINPKLWSFLVAAILAFLNVALRAFLWGILWSFCAGILSALMILLFRALWSATYSLLPLFALLMLIGFVIILFIYAWFFLKLLEIYSPFLIYELPLAVEEEITSSTTINRSQQLVQGVRRSLVKTIILATVATIPVSILSLLLWLLIAGFIQGVTSTPSEESTSTVIEQVIWIIYWTGLSILLTPFWQALKSMVYYNLRCQKEAFDLPLTLSSPTLYDNDSDFRGLGSEQ